MREQPPGDGFVLAVEGGGWRRRSWWGAFESVVAVEFLLIVAMDRVAVEMVVGWCMRWWSWRRWRWWWRISFWPWRE